MNKILLLLFTGACLVKLPAQTPAQEINELLKQYAKQHSFNGVALVAHRGEILLHKGYGFRDVSSQSLADSNTIFQIGSLTKQFTASIILQLQEQHALSVTDKLSSYINGFPGGDSITIENLLTHTSGVHDYTSEGAYMKSNLSRPVMLMDLISLFKSKPLDFSPGSKYSYSNSGYILLGYIIEKVTGKSYFQVVREKIFGPLQMMHSGFDFKNLKNIHKATGYLKLTAKTNLVSTIVDSSQSYAAGSMYTTAADLYKWDRALYTNKIIHDSSIQKAFTPFKNNYGYGWIIDSLYSKKVVMHEGGIFGFVSFIARIPADSTCIILLENVQSPGLPKIAESINSILNQQPYDFPRNHSETDVDSATLKKYVGEYELSTTRSIKITFEDGHLMLQITGLDKNELFAEKENLFFLKFEDAQIEFLNGPDNKTDRLIITKYSQHVTAIKIK